MDRTGSVCLLHACMVLQKAGKPGHDASLVEQVAGKLAKI